MIYFSVFGESSTKFFVHVFVINMTTSNKHHLFDLFEIIALHYEAISRLEPGVIAIAMVFPAAVFPVRARPAAAKASGVHPFFSFLCLPEMFKLHTLSVTETFVSLARGADSDTFLNSQGTFFML